MNKSRIQAILVLLSIFFLSAPSHAVPPGKDFYQIRIYRFTTNEQQQQIDQYLKEAYLPALHRAGIKKVGVFIPLANDTVVARSIYVFIPYPSFEAFTKIDKQLQKDAVYNESAKKFKVAAFDHPPYERMESILLEAFEGQKHFVLPSHKEGTVFELRSYESPTEKLYEKKTGMFENGEIELFKKLDFQTVFYARVISGSRMPNFMYMPSFESLDQKNAHWKIFGADPQWKEMSSKPENENKVSVSRIESILMKRAEYSDL